MHVTKPSPDPVYSTVVSECALQNPLPLPSLLPPPSHPFPPIPTMMFFSQSNGGVLPSALIKNSALCTAAVTHETFRSCNILLVHKVLVPSLSALPFLPLVSEVDCAVKHCALNARRIDPQQLLVVNGCPPVTRLVSPGHAAVPPHVAHAGVRVHSAQVPLCEERYDRQLRRGTGPRFMCLLRSSTSE